MPHTLPEGATGRKPAGPRTPAPTRDRHAVWRALANSAFNTDALVIVKAARDLVEMIEKFQEDHDEGSLLRELRQAGLRRSAPAGYAEHITQSALHDLAGLCWSVELGADMLNSVLLESPPANSTEGASNG